MAHAGHPTLAHGFQRWRIDRSVEPWNGDGAQIFSPLCLKALLKDRCRPSAVLWSESQESQGKMKNKQHWAMNMAGNSLYYFLYCTHNWWSMSAEEKHAAVSHEEIQCFTRTGWSESVYPAFWMIGLDTATIIGQSPLFMQIADWFAACGNIDRQNVLAR